MNTEFTALKKLGRIGAENTKMKLTYNSQEFKKSIKLNYGGIYTLKKYCEVK